MAWQDRLKEAAYTSPSGIRLTFDFENVSRTVEKKTAGFEFPDADGTLVQTSGKTGRRYPIRAFFSGNDHDLEATAFEDALTEDGTGKLEHPMYGTANVVPFGAIARRDNLKTEANQSVVEVTFWDTIDTIYPTAQIDPASSVLTAVSDYNDVAASEFEELTDLDSATEQASFKNTYQDLLGRAESSLQVIADTQEDVQKQFNAISDSIDQGIDILIQQPLTLAFQTIQLIQAPGRALTSIKSRLSAFENLADSIISGDGAVQAPGNDSTNSNVFHVNDLYASTAVTGSIVSVINNQFTTKTEALEAAEAILTQMEDVTNWRDDNFESLEEIDTGGAYQQLQDAVALTAGFLVEISFTLKQERRLVLDRNRTMIDLVAELYSKTDEILDFFISSNDLSGDEHIEILRGREIVWYV